MSKFTEQLLTIIAIIVLAILIYALDYNDTKVEQLKEGRINNIEQRLTYQEQYMYQVQVDIDNLYRVVE